MGTIKILILGSKEYPMGINKDDPIPSGGMEVHINEFMKGLSGNKDFEIKIITRQFRGIAKREKNGNIEIYRTPWIKGFYFRNITFNLFAFFRGLSIDFDIIHAHGVVSALFGLVLARVKGVPLITTPHGLAFNQPQYPKLLRYLLKEMEKFVYSHANYLFFLSEQEKKEFRKKLGFIPKKSRITHTGIDFEKYKELNPGKIVNEFNLEEKTVISFVGRLVGVKGAEYLVRAVEGIANENFVVLIVGEGPNKRKLHALAEKSKVLDKIIFTGFRSDVLNILAASNIFVLPSLSEGLPIALLEAMALKNACIVTDIGLPVEDGVTGLVVPPKDVQKLRGAIEKLLNDKELQKELGERAKKEIEERFSWEKAIEKHIETFKALSNMR